jgi:hypothetical protein
MVWRCVGREEMTVVEASRSLLCGAHHAPMWWRNVEKRERLPEEEKAP